MYTCQIYDTKIMQKGKSGDGERKGQSPISNYELKISIQFFVNVISCTIIGWVDQIMNLRTNALMKEMRGFLTKRKQTIDN